MKKSFIFLFCLLFLFLSPANAKKVPENMEVEESSETMRCFDYFFYSAIALRQQGKLSEAMDLLYKCRLISPENSALLFELSQIQALCGQEEESFENLLAAAYKTPENRYYQERLMLYYAAYKKYDDAIAVCLRLIRDYPDQEQYIYNLLQYYTVTNRPKEAMKQLEKIEQLSGVQESVSFEKMKIFFSLDAPQKAMKELEKLTAKYPDETRYSTMLGDILMDKGKEKKALSVYKAILQKNPKDGRTLLSLAEFYKKKGEEDRSDQMLFDVLNEKNESLELKLEILERYLMQTLRNSEKKEETERVFSLLLEAYGHEERVQLYYVNYLLFQKDNDKAKEHIKTVLDINPYREEMWQKLLELSDQDLDQMIKTVSQALEYFPESSYFYYFQAVAFQEKRQFPEAISSIGKAIGCLKEDNLAALSQFWGIKGDLLFSNNEKESAFQAYEKALELNAGNLMVLNNYAYFLALEGKNLRKAERMSGKTVEAEPANATFLDTYAWIFFMRQEYSLAKFYIERAIAQDNGKNSEIYLHQGDILFQCGNVKDAVSAWEKAVERGNSSEELRQKIDKHKHTEK